MAQLQVTRIIEAPIDRVWAAWDAFGDVDRFNPNIRASYLINASKATGLGAERKCEMADGKNFIKERIVGYEPPTRMVIEAFACTLPLKDIRVTLDFAARTCDETEVTLTMNFHPNGILGHLMMPMMKKDMAVALGRLLAGNKAYSEVGLEIPVAA